MKHKELIADLSKEYKLKNPTLALDEIVDKIITRAESKKIKDEK